MPIAAQLERVIDSSICRENRLSDGHSSVTYGALSGIFSAFTDYFARQAIGYTGCLAVEVPNTLAGGLLLLYLLREEMSFVLLPPSEQGEESSAWKPVPHFCSHRLVVRRGPVDANGAWLGRPENFLTLDANPTYQPPVDPGLHTPGYLFLRTSGSMGASKLVVHSHETLLANAQGCVAQYEYTSGDRVTIPVPIAHMYGLGVGFLPGVLAGASIDLQDQTNLLRYLAHERHFQPTVAVVTPTLAGMLLKGFKSPRSYRLAITATQRIGEATFRAFDAAIGGTFVNQYGSSEMGAIAVCAPGDGLAYKATTIGTPFPGVQLRVEERASGEGGEGGELHCQHPAGFIGYVDESGQWLQRRNPHEWYRTGDLAHSLPNGYFQITGRAGNSMNRRGYLVQFGEIERQMEQIAGLEQVVVVGRSDAERLTAFCVPRNSVSLTDAQVREACFERLPKYAIPDAVMLLESLPLLPSGKVDRQRLTAMVS